MDAFKGPVAEGFFKAEGRLLSLAGLTHTREEGAEGPRSPSLSNDVF